MTELKLRACIDVEDLERAIAFYTQALGLHVGRRHKNLWAELLGASAPLDLLTQPAGSSPCLGGSQVRDYQRHWTPVHLDFEVANLDEAVSRAIAAGAKLERDIKTRPWGRMANLSDPFGHGICLLEMQGSGYDILATGPA